MAVSTIIIFFNFYLGIFCGSDGRKICLQCRRPGLHPCLGKITYRRNCLPTPVFLPGAFHGERSLADYSPWGRKESDMTEPLTFSLLFISLGASGLNCSMQNLWLWHVGFSRCGAWALESDGSVAVACGLRCPVICGVLVPRPGVKPMSPALGGRFLITGLPGKSPLLLLITMHSLGVTAVSVHWRGLPWSSPYQVPRACWAAGSPQTALLGNSCWNAALKWPPPLRLSTAENPQSSLVSEAGEEVGDKVKSDWECGGSGLWGLKTPNSTLCPGRPCFGNLVGRADANTKMPSYLGTLLIAPNFFLFNFIPRIIFRERCVVQAGVLGLIPGFRLTFVFYLITIKLFYPIFNSFGQSSCMYALSCLTLWDPMDYSLSGSPVHGIFQARILKLVVISFSRGIFPIQGSNPRPQRLLRWQADSLPLSHPVFYYLCDLVQVTFEASAASFAKARVWWDDACKFLSRVSSTQKMLLFFNWIPMSVPRRLNWDWGQQYSRC